MTDPGPISLPAELWLLWQQADQCWIRSIDDARNGATYLVAFSRAEAEKAAEHQNDMYNLDCTPVRVWPREAL